MNLPSNRRHVLVACDPATAYDLFLHDIGTWWPVESYGCSGAGSSVACDGTRIVETAPSGETAVWGTVLDSDAPRSLAFVWHPGRDPESASRVAVSFAPSGSGTLVTLEHDGWEGFADPSAARAESLGGWAAVLDDYASNAADDSEGSDGTEQWFLLEHTAADGLAGAVFSDPRFPKHGAFLRTLSDRAVLIAAGPVLDEPGNGVTIVRAPDHATAREVVAAAQDADGAVTEGLLEVRVRPWRVMVSA